MEDNKVKNETKKDIKKEPKKEREKVFNVKVNKKALEKFMAKLFWCTLAIITLVSAFLFIMSISSLYSAWMEVSESLYNAWVAIRTPLVTSVLCVAWFGMMFLFIKLIKE